MLLYLVVLALLTASGCRSRPATPLRVFIAGSLVVPFAELERAYEARHPEVDVQVEAHGSIQVIRHVTEIHDPIDVVVPADYALIPMLMYAAKVPGSETPYASWDLQFAGNRLVLAYTDASRYAGEIDASNWYQVIARDGVLFGLSDPRFDAAGYRALMIVQLAEAFYNDPTIFEQLFLGAFTQPIRSQKNAGLVTIHVPELLETSEDSSVLVRGGSVALLALLESGDLDYTFEYASVASQHGLRTVELPAELNLGEPALASGYESVQVQLDFQRFASVPPNFRGEAIAYGVTIPGNAPHPQQAEDFVAFMLGPDGREIMQANEHPMLDAYRVDHPEALPESLRALLP